MSADFLDTLVTEARLRPAAGVLAPATRAARRRGRLADALQRPGLSLIAEHKRRSPALGPLREDLDVRAVVRNYDLGGASAVSVLVQGPHFGGSLEDLRLARSVTDLPLLAKDVVARPGQIEEAADAGADAVLLIAAALDDRELAELAATAAACEVDVLWEVHHQAEIVRVLDAGATIIGVNSRDLASFAVSTTRPLELLAAIPDDVLVVAESGVRTRAQLERFADAGFHGALVGTTLMRADDQRAQTAALVAGHPVRPGRPRHVRLERRFGRYGGQYVPETLVTALDELDDAIAAALTDATFLTELHGVLRRYVGRPTPLALAERLSERVGRSVYLKREDLAHTGSHKLNNALAQVLLARRMGKRRIIAETGAGQHGVATATACALLGMDCEIFMGRADTERQAPNVERMQLLGATVRPIDAGSATLKEATSAAIREWVATVEDTHYAIGSAVGPAPYPALVREIQRVIGDEARAQVLDAEGALPGRVVACVGGGSNAIGMFTAFLDDAGVDLVGVEAGGAGLASGRHGAPLTAGGPAGVLHGALSAVMQDARGQIAEAHSISAGLDYPGSGPEHAHLRDVGRVRYDAVTDEAALAAFRLLCRLEGIVPALESSHAVAWLLAAPAHTSPDLEVLCLSGRGDKDLAHVLEQRS